MPESGRVALVGAGPGDPGLLTLRGAEALRRAEVVVYDCLASAELLRHAPDGAERIYVGKRAGRHTLRQEGINALLVRLARAGKEVVRLKGGDPFVFGRGGEEAAALAAAGIPFEVVPGVTSAVAVPAYAGIPVTQRGLASSLAIVTGHEDPGKAESAIDWAALAGIDTLVFLMGAANLPRIADGLIAHGRAPETPAALIQWGTLGTQRTVTGTLADIAARAREAGLSSPAVTVVGRVVGLREKLGWFDRRPLWGLRVLVTRTREQAGQLSGALRGQGAEPVECPLIATAPPHSWERMDAAIARLVGPHTSSAERQHGAWHAQPTQQNSCGKPLGAFQWVVFTSANGVRAFFERLALADGDARALAGARIAAIGPATADALAGHGLRADLVPGEYVAEAVAAGMGEVRGLRVLLPRADLARPALAQALRAGGAEVEEVVAYRTVAPAGLQERLQTATGECDVITFTSSSAVEHLAAALGPRGVAEAAERAAVACIGPVTAEAARRAGLAPAVVAEEYTVEGLVRAIVAWRAGLPPHLPEGRRTAP